VVELDLPMPVHRVYAHEKVEADQGRVALVRGPIVYCLEAVDHPEVDLLKVSLPREAELSAEHRPSLLGGVTVLRGRAQVMARDANGAGNPRTVDLTAVPYYTWCNRGPGRMVVWLPCGVAASPGPSGRPIPGR